MTEEQLNFLFDTIIRVAGILIRQNKFNYSNTDLEECRSEFVMLFPGREK